MTDSNNKLLTYIYQNSEMGKDTTRQLIGITNDTEIKTMLESQYKEYNYINGLTEQKLRERQKEAKDISPIKKAASYLSINLNTLTNKNPWHISEMLIQGSTMGVIDITKKLNAYRTTADKDVLDLGNSLLSFEQRNIEECKKYLQ